MGAKPQSSVVIPDIVGQFGDIKRANRLIKRELREVQGEIKKAIRANQAIAPELQTRLRKAEMLNNNLEKAKRSQRELQHRQRELRYGEETTRAQGRAVRYLLGAQALGDMIRGDLLDPRALGQFAFSSAEHVQDFARRKFGESSKTFRFARGAAAVAPAAAEAFTSWMAALEEIKADVVELRTITTKMSSGELTESMQESFWRVFQKSQTSFASPYAEWKDIQALSMRIAKFEDRETSKVLAPAVREQIAKAESSIKWNIFGSASEQLDQKNVLLELSEKSIALAIPAAIKKREDELGLTKVGRQLSEKERNLVKQEVLLDSISKLTPAIRGELKQRILELEASLGTKFKAQIDSAARIRREASEKFREQERKKLFEIEFARNQRRVALDGRIGD